MDFRFNKFCKNLNKNDKRIMTTMPKLMFNNELLVLMPYIYSMSYAYSFCQIFQALHLFLALRLFRTLENVHQ